jgi:hypothetical protein
MRYPALVILSFFIFMGYSMASDFHIDDIKRQPSLSRFDLDFSDRIESARRFSEKLVTAYLDALYERVDPVFKDDFLLWKSDKLRTRAVFSSITEAFVYIFPASENDLIADCTKYPIQMALFNYLFDISDHSTGVDDEQIDFSTRYQDLPKTYMDMITNVIVSEPGSAYIVSKGGGVRFRNPSKVITFSKHSAMTFAGTSVEIQRENFPTFKFRFDGIGVLTGDTDFSGLIQFADQIGRSVAEWEIQQLFASSEYIKSAASIKKLESIAKEIITKQSRAEKDNSFSYPFNEFELDVSNLHRKARDIGFDTTYIDKLMNYQLLKPKDGTLLWYYRGYSDFTLQWTLINAILLSLLTLFSLLEHRYDKIANMLMQIKKPLFLLLPVAVNGWVFTCRPHFLPLPYWIIPGIIFIICLCVPLIFGKS